MSGTNRTIGVVGTGVIGVGWAIRALSRGYDVVAWDPAPGAEPRLMDAIERAWPSATKLGLFPGADPSRVRFAVSPEELASRVDWIQENAPENEDLKRALLATLAGACGPDVVIASSSSGLLPSRLQEACAHPERILIGHPFNPVYLLPLVEVVAGEETSPDAVEAAVDHYDDLVMHPLVVRHEIEGYLSDRLQEALWREVLHLVNDGIATTEELDDAVAYGPGIRWAGMGTNLTFHLAGGEQGMRHMLRQFGPALKLPWTKLVAPELTEDLIEAMADGCADQADGRSIPELEVLRDNYVLSVMNSLRPFDLGAGRLMAEREARILALSETDKWTAGDQPEAPLSLYTATVEPDWVDGHNRMTEAAFLAAFGRASVKLFRYVGIDDDYRDDGYIFLPTETRLNYLGEVMLGEPLMVTTQVMDNDSERLCLFHSAYQAETGQLVATAEQTMRHVDIQSGVSDPIQPGPAAALASIVAAHSALPRPRQR